MKENLLIVTSSDQYGSASAKLLRLMGAGLIKKGWRVEVLLQRGRQNKGEKNQNPFWHRQQSDLSPSRMETAS